MDRSPLVTNLYNVETQYSLKWSLNYNLKVFVSIQQIYHLKCIVRGFGPDFGSVNLSLWARILQISEHFILLAAFLSVIPA